MTADDAALIRLRREQSGQLLGSASVTPEMIDRLIRAGLIERDPRTRLPRLTAAGERRVTALTDRGSDLVPLRA